MIDTTAGGFAADYIDTVSMNLLSACGTLPTPPVQNDIILHPNPVRNHLTLKVTTPYAIDNMVIRIANTNGEIVSVERRSKPAGTTSFELPAYHLASGKYYVSIYNKEQLVGTRELIKL